MKALPSIILFAAIAFQSCTSKKPGASHMAMVQKTDSLNAMVNKIKPGLGELMLGIQLHHEKLWFAGANRNWPLAAFEAGEIKETMEQAMQIETDRPEVKTLPMLAPAVDSVAAAIAAESPARFQKSYTTLTNTCNSCHQLNHFGFNVIKTPTVPPVSDQEFEPAK